jgi:hypothetical protein
MNTPHQIGRLIYQGFAENQLHLWDSIVADDVEIRSTVGEMPLFGREKLKGWAAEFLKAFAPRIDLVDEFDNGRDHALITVNIHWRHLAPFFQFAPTQKSGTSVEYFVLTIAEGAVTRFWVVDRTLDLVMYLTRDLGVPYPTLFTPTPIIAGKPQNP